MRWRRSTPSCWKSWRGSSVGGRAVGREATLLVVALAVCGPLCAIGGALTRPAAGFPRSGRDAEALMWRRLWMPLLPACVALAVLLGWTAQEPDQTDNALHPALLVVALPG